MLGKKIAIDLGTESVRMLVKGEGAILSEPNVVLAGGNGAGSAMLGTAALRAAADDRRLRPLRPVDNGTIADGAHLRLLIGQLMVRAVGRQRIFKPDLVISVMPAMAGDDRRTVLDAAMAAGARTVYLIDSTMAGAMGSGVPVSSTTGHLVADLGAGKSEIAVIAMESTIAHASLPGHGGNALAQSVRTFLRDRRGAHVAKVALDDVVTSLLRVGPHEERRLTVTGTIDGAEGTLTVTSTELAPLLDEHLRPIVGALHEVLRDTPASLLDDIHREGMLLFGGGARLEGLDRQLAGATSVRTRVDGDAVQTVIRGAGYALDNLDVLKRNFMYLR